MRRLAALLAVPVFAPAAHAHGGGMPIAPSDIWHHWSFDPPIVILLILGHWLYGRGLARAWTRAGLGRIIPLWRAACFLAGEAVLVVALISPIDPLGETLLSAHMGQHILLSAVALPLLLLGHPLRAWTWALPQRWRRLGATPPLRALGRAADALSAPVRATTLAIAAMLAWHVPVLFEAALQNETIHTFEHITFFATSLLAWRTVLSPRTGNLTAAAIVLAIFMAGGMLGGLLALAPVQLYDWYGDHSRLWDLTPIEDQQLAGMLMWAPGGGIYLVAFAVLAVRAADASGDRRSRRNIGIMRASTSSRSMK
jgi:putative membrane protein